MEMELVVEPDDAARLTRLKEFLRHRTASSRPRALRTLWHDSPDRALAEDGMILAEARDGWHLEQLHPGPAAWPPASCPPVLEQAEQPSTLAHPLPALLTPIASCTAREMRHDLSVEGEPVT